MSYRIKLTMKDWMMDWVSVIQESTFLCVSDQTEAEGAGSKGRHQTELEKAVRWISLPKGWRGNEEEEHRLKVSGSIVKYYHIILYFVWITQIKKIIQILFQRTLWIENYKNCCDYCHWVRLYLVSDVSHTF